MLGAHSQKNGTGGPTKVPRKSQAPLLRVALLVEGLFRV